jgi:hypothetical protein
VRVEGERSIGKGVNGIDIFSHCSGRHGPFSNGHPQKARSAARPANIALAEFKCAMKARSTQRRRRKMWLIHHNALQQFRVSHFQALKPG